MKESKRNKFSAQTKGKVALEAWKGLKTVNEIAVLRFTENDR